MVVLDDGKVRNVEDGEVFIEASDRYTWYGGSHSATRVDPGYTSGDECPHCDESGYLIGEYTPREMREEMEL